MGRRPGARPVVGVVGHDYTVPMPFGCLPVTGTPRAFPQAVAEAGGRPVLVRAQDAAGLLDLLDGLVLTGGGDVDPALYGGGPEGAHRVDRGRDEWEIAVVRAACESRVPVLGVCRGLQVLTVAFGGSLRGDVPHVLPESGHKVVAAPGTLAHRLLGPRVRTSALHHQAVADPGPAWRPTAWAADGVVEAIEPVVDGWQVLGVQWHPELGAHAVPGDGTGPAVVGWLVGAARARRARRTAWQAFLQAPAGSSDG